MEYLSEEYLKKRIEQNQKFLVSLLNVHIGDYYPLRKWLGIDYKGKIDEVSHLSIGYNTKYFKKGKKWYKQQTREYQHPDLGYKLNLVLDRIPQLVLLPALLQPAFRLASVLLFSLTTTTYQPASVEANISQENPNTAWADGTTRHSIGYQASISVRFNSCFNFDLSDISNGAAFSDATFNIYLYGNYNASTSRTLDLMRLTTTGFTDNATWNTYNGINNWTTPGGDYTTTNKVSYTGTAPNPGWLSWTSAQTLIQDCWNNQSKHAIFIARDPNATNAYAIAYSCHYTTDPSLRPKLTVTYTVPVPSNFFLFFNN